MNGMDMDESTPATNTVAGDSATAARLSALLEQLTAVISGNETAHNDAVVDQIFGLLLGKPGAPQSSEEFGLLELFCTDLASTPKPIAAHACFERLLRVQQQPPHAKASPRLTRLLRTALNLDNVRHQLVERWHFRMLNDRQRNEAYRSAIEAAVRAVPDAAGMRVLDIGTGTGLLAMYAHRAGAGHVYACDDSPLMCAVARQTFAHSVTNAGRPQPRVLERHSTTMSADELLDDGGDVAADGRVDLIVTETLDAGAFGEGILQTLQHAHKHLLRPGGRVIPSAVQLYIAGFESRTVALEQVGMNGDFGELVYMQGSRLRASHTPTHDGDSDGHDGGDDDDDEEPYDSDSVHNIRDFSLITRVEPAFGCDFQRPEDIASALSGEREQTVRLEYAKVGHLDGFVVWFRLQLDDDRSIHTAPPDVLGGGGDPRSQRCECWDQALFKLNTRFANSQRLQNLNVTVSCAGGRLRVRHFYDGSARSVLPVPADTVRFVNDAEYLTRLEYEFGRVPYRFVEDATTATMTDPNVGNVLDLCPFPHIGFGLLKERRASRLYCAAATAPLMQFVAAANCLDAAQSLRFVRDMDDVWRLPAELRFDVILVAPIDGLGVLDAAQVRAYRRLQRERLRPGGRMMPHRVEIWGQLVRSEWLRRVTRVTRSDAGGVDDLMEWGIADAMNRFATRQQLGLGFFEHDYVSGSFRVAEVQWGGGVDGERDDRGGAAAAVPSTSTNGADVASTSAAAAAFDANGGASSSSSSSHNSNTSSSNIINGTTEEDERYVLVRLPKEVPESDLHGMLCFYKIWLMEDSAEPISTRRFASHVRRMCFVLDRDAGAAADDDAVRRQTSRAVVHVRQHEGLVECSLYKRFGWREQAE